MTIAVAIVLALFGVLSLLVVPIGLPGTWLMIVAAIGVELWRPETFGWSTFLALAGLAALGELIELIAGALGAKSRGASRRAMLGATIGGIVGAIVGTIVLAFLPIVGTLLGSAIGAGVGAMALELTKQPLVQPPVVVERGDEAGVMPPVDVADGAGAAGHGETAREGVVVIDSRGRIRRATGIGAAAAVGRLVAVVAKTAIGAVMLGVLVTAAVV